MLEHMVDTVLYFEGEAGGLHRLLRARRIRFGSTDEIGVFAMTGRGLEPISNPSEIFLSQRPDDAAGSAVIPALQSRPILLEVQALVHGGMPSGRRTALGLDRNRINLLTAVLERRVGLAFADHDLYLSVVGGARLSEPAADLALAAAIWCRAFATCRSSPRRSASERSVSPVNCDRYTPPRAASKKPPSSGSTTPSSRTPARS